MRDLWEHKLGGLIALCLLIILFMIPLFSIEPAGYLRYLIGGQYTTGALAFILLIFLSTVVAPVTVPLAVPVAAPFLGPWQTALFAIVGWVSGAALAFVLARRFGRPLIARILDLKKIDRLQVFIPDDEVFWRITLLRLLLPVDLLSYALGLLPKIPLTPYLLATALGVAPFAFIMAYAGDALILKDYGRVVGLIPLSGLIFFIGFLIMRGKQ